jgi:hypothetical protein
MFGNRRKKVTAQTIEMARQPLAILQDNYGLPPKFWADEFVLGYFGTTIGFLSHMLGEGKLDHEDKGFILIETFTALSNMNGKAIADRATELAQSNPKSEDFELGADNGSIVTLAVFGKVTPIGQGAVARAQRLADKRGDPEQMLSILMMSKFIGPISKRFDLSQ